MFTMKTYSGIEFTDVAVYQKIDEVFAAAAVDRKTLHHATKKFIEKDMIHNGFTRMMRDERYVMYAGKYEFLIEFDGDDQMTITVFQYMK